MKSRSRNRRRRSRVHPAEQKESQRSRSLRKDLLQKGERLGSGWRMALVFWLALSCALALVTEALAMSENAIVAGGTGGSGDSGTVVGKGVAIISVTGAQLVFDVASVLVDSERIFPDWDYAMVYFGFLSSWVTMHCASLLLLPASFTFTSGGGAAPFFASQVLLIFAVVLVAINIILDNPPLVPLDDDEDAVDEETLQETGILYLKFHEPVEVKGQPHIRAEQWTPQGVEMVTVHKDNLSEEQYTMILEHHDLAHTTKIVHGVTFWLMVAQLVIAQLSYVGQF